MKHVCGTKLDYSLRSRLNQIKEIRDIFIAKISDREKMSKSFKKYIIAFNYAHRELLVLSVLSSVAIQVFGLRIRFWKVISVRKVDLIL